MTQEEAFIQAIRSAPEDDAPRLIYADWLEEHGQAERADFIRIQCRLFGIPEADPSAATLRARAEEMLRDNWHTWVSPLRELVGPKYDRYGETWMSEDYQPEGLRRFRRGFVDAITLDAERFLAQAKTVLELLPLHALRVWGGGRCAAELLRCPHLAGLHTLAFVDYFSDPLTPRDALALAASPYVHGLRALYLGWNSLGDEGVESLTRARWLTSLVTLDLSQNGLTDAAALALASCPYLRELQTLYLRRNSISSHARTVLASSPCLQHVTKLELLD
jgi:uncharacterized protein (TIGR02996 family)